MFTPRDEYWMQQALMLATQAAAMGEVPVGAVLVQEDRLLSEGYNCPIATCDPQAHAEIITLRAGARKNANYRLIDTTLYVTLEPCLMCAGAMVHARISRLVYGATDPRAGAVVSQACVLDFPFLNHRIEHAGGLLAVPCGDILSEFFRQRRAG